MSSRNLEWALRYLEQGMHPIPVRLGIKVNKDGEKEKDVTFLIQWKPYQTKQPTKEEVTEWWTTWPDANIALVCGETSGIAVIDVDDPSFDTSVLPDTLKEQTSIGKTHWYYRFPKGMDLRNSTEGDGFVIEYRGKALDVRGNGGVSITYPSIHPLTGKAYTWLNLKTDVLMKDQMAEFPTHLISKASKNERREPVDILKRLHKGERNDEMHRKACSLLNDYSDIEAFELLTSLNTTHCEPPLDDDELKTAFESARTFIKQNPSQKPVEPAVTVQNGKQVIEDISEDSVVLHGAFDCELVDDKIPVRVDGFRRQKKDKSWANGFLVTVDGKSSWYGTEEEAKGSITNSLGGVDFYLEYEGRKLPKLKDRWSKTGVEEVLNEGARKEDVATLFNDVEKSLQRHYKIKSDRGVLVTAFVLMSYVWPTLGNVPFLNIRGKKDSGKSRLQAWLAATTYNGKWQVQPSLSTLRKSLDGMRSTFHYDQADHLNKLELIEMVNLFASSYGGGTTSISVQKGKNWEEVEFECKSPKTFASHGVLPFDLQDRCIIIRVSPAEKGLSFLTVEENESKVELAALRDRLYHFGIAYFGEMWERKARLQAIEDKLGILKNRQLELWLPLAVILELAGKNLDECRKTFEECIGFAIDEAPALYRVVLQKTHHLLGGKDGTLHLDDIHAGIPRDHFEEHENNKGKRVQGEMSKATRSKLVAEILIDSDVIDPEDKRVSNGTCVDIEIERLEAAMRASGVPIPSETEAEEWRVQW